MNKYNNLLEKIKNIIKFNYQITKQLQLELDEKGEEVEKIIRESLQR
jgi:hypothetical protein